MSLFIKQDDNRSELQKRLATELQDRAKIKPKEYDMPDGVEDSQYVEGMKKTTSLAWVWIILIVATLGIVVWLMALEMSRN